MTRLVITVGDPNGIGPEITVKALQRVTDISQFEVTIIGSLRSLEASAKQLGLALPHSASIDYLAIEADKPGDVSYLAITKAVELIASRKADAMVTGPISKKNLQDAGHIYSGHTEILEGLSQRYFDNIKFNAEMLFVHESLRLLILTRHIPLAEVSAALAKPGAISRPLKTLISFLRHRLGISEPCLAILAVNPHAGEVGGHEERNLFMPVIQAINAIGATRVEGPFPADGFFRNFSTIENKYDAIVSTYHDQGLIPFKMLSGYQAVNVTIGLPFLRTSVSHGTAEDIVGKNAAREESLIAAIKLALSLSKSP